MCVQFALYIVIHSDLSFQHIVTHRIQFAPFTVCCSGMKTSEQRTVCEMVGRYGGTVVPTWTKECVALIMNKLTVTQKVIASVLSLCVLFSLMILLIFAKPAQRIFANKPSFAIILLTLYHMYYEQEGVNVGIYEKNLARLF